MKILLFANRVIEPVHSMTGIGRYVKELTLGIIAANKSSRWTYDLCAPGEGRQPGWLPADMGYRRVPGPRKLVHAAWTAIGAPRLERLVGTFDLIHALHPSYPIPTGGPAMITLHDLLPLRHPEWYRRDENLGFRRTLDVVGERGWGVIVNSEYVGRQVRELGTISPDRISVVHMAVGDEFRHPVDAVHVSAACASLGLTPGRYFMALGTVSTRKNLVTLVRAMASVEPVDVPLVLAGRADTGAGQVRSEIERLGLEKRVRLAGFVTDDTLPALLQGATALLHPSADEGFGIPPLEAMAAGTPVVAARAGALPEIVANAGLLVDAHDAVGWASAISDVASNLELRLRLRATGRARAAGFTWDKVARETWALHRRQLG